MMNDYLKDFAFMMSCHYMDTVNMSRRHLNFKAYRRLLILSSKPVLKLLYIVRF